MNYNQIKKILNHYNKFFNSETYFSFSPISQNLKLKITILVYEPNEKFPFWKLCTIGASDYKMKKSKDIIGNFNEYVMFVDKNEKLDEDLELRNWYFEYLLICGNFPFTSKSNLSYRHDIYLPYSNDEMVGLCILLPEIIEDINFLTNKISTFKKVFFLQVMPITKIEREILINENFETVEKLFYPENKENFQPFAQKHRNFKI